MQSWSKIAISYTDFLRVFPDFPVIAIEVIRKKKFSYSPYGQIDFQKSENKFKLLFRVRTMRRKIADQI